MANLSSKQKVIGVIAIIGTILILIFQSGFYSKPAAKREEINNPATQNPEVVSTSPNPLEKAIIWGTTPIEITFNLSVQNIPELKYTFEPESDIKAELLNDRKTVRFTPNKPLPLGADYTLTIPAGAKFDDDKTLGKDYKVHFRTIEYRGV
ncbi:MAG: Ig-like domain-containing protein [Candidatus Daviesbacteria bacterium]|nr:Ig-like domain-containing protein [Candidatus Daviesbacteria bacterium]